jgi:uncharacterized protein YxjI
MSTNSKKAIQEIKNLMKQFGFMSDETVLASFKLEDTTIIQAKELKVGESITKINDAFEQVALEDGTFRLKENFEIEVKDGKLVAVKEIFLDAKLADGTQIKVEGDSLLEGAKVVVVTEQGEIPAPDAVHELEDGSKVETKDGIIVKIEPAMEEVEAEQVVPPVDEQVGVPEQVELMDMLKEFIKKMSEKMASMENKMSSVEQNFEAFKKEPAAKKIADGKTEFNKINSTPTDDIVAGIMRLRNNNK